MVKQVSGLLYSSNSEYIGKLNEYGEEGWELVFVCIEGQSTYPLLQKANGITKPNKKPPLLRGGVGSVKFSRCLLARSSMLNPKPMLTPNLYGPC
jgi:hypothetical protein